MATQWLSPQSVLGLSRSTILESVIIVTKFSLQIISKFEFLIILVRIRCFVNVYEVRMTTSESTWIITKVGTVK